MSITARAHPPQRGPYASDGATYIKVTSATVISRYVCQRTSNHDCASGGFTDYERTPEVPWFTDGRWLRHDGPCMWRETVLRARLPA